MENKAMKLFGFYSVATLCVITVNAQDTLRLTLPEAEELFMNRNLFQLANTYKIDSAKAKLIGARLFNNRHFLLKRANYDSKSSAIPRLINLAGQRNSELTVNAPATGGADGRFFDLLRTLRFLLRSTFYKEYFLQNTLNGFQTQITTLEKLTAEYKVLNKDGVASEKDLVRIKSLLYRFEMERALLQNQRVGMQSELGVLLQNSRTFYAPVVSDSVLTTPAIGKWSMPYLLETAIKSRIDLKSESGLEDEVHDAYVKVLNANTLLTSIESNFPDQVESLLRSMVDNFRKKNIGLMELTDFYESYENDTLQLNQSKDELLQAEESLYFALGKTLASN